MPKRRYVEDGVMSDAKALAISRSKRPDELVDSRDNFDTTAAEAEASSSQTPQEAEHKTKHTLDSDEEEEEKYDKLDMNKVEGQVDATIEHEGQTKITPFNMREELDDGHFDSNGNFVFNKDKGDIADAWLDNIDWSHAKRKAGSQWQESVSTAPGQQPEQGTEDSEAPLPVVPVRELYGKMLVLLQPKETVTRAIKRLGGNRTAGDERKARWAEKRRQKEQKESGSADGALVETASPVAQLTSLVDQLVAAGHYEAYGYTREKLQFECERMDKQSTVDLDMFSEPTDTSAESSTKPSVSVSSLSGQVQWQFKWSNDGEAAIEGPHSSEQMLEWQESGHFKEGVFVRKVNSDPAESEAPFYSSKRVDFDLYV